MPNPIANLLSSFDHVNLNVTPDIPYEWNDGQHDIPMTMINIPIIGMAYAHEGGEPPRTSHEDFSAAKEAATADEPSDEAVEEYTRMQVNYRVYEELRTYAQWYLVLVACHQTRALTSSNLRQYAAMTGSKPLPPNTIKYLNYWSATRDSLAGNSIVRQKFLANKFFDYHTTGSSTPRLCQRAVEEAVGLGLFSRSEIEDIKNACEQNHDLEVARELSSMLLVKTRAVLEAAGNLPDVWYMGSRAKDEFSGQKYSAVVKVVREIFKKKTDTENIEEKSIPTLAKTARELLNCGVDEESTVTVEPPASRKFYDLEGHEKNEGVAEDPYFLGSKEGEKGKKGKGRTRKGGKEKEEVGRDKEAEEKGELETATETEVEGGSEGREEEEGKEGGEESGDGSGSEEEDYDEEGGEYEVGGGHEGRGEEGHFSAMI